MSAYGKTEQEISEDFLGLRKKTPPTSGQLGYAHSLLRERVPYGAVADAENSSNSEAAHELVNAMDKRECSAFIDAMKLQPRRPKPAPRTQPITATEGMYKKNGEIYKVQVAHHGSGHLYAKQLHKRQLDNGDWEAWFEFSPGTIQSLTEADRMSLEEAKQFGALYGVCCRCGKILTDEVSIAAGIGPVCAGKFS